jgi:hypothetical protein
VTGADIDISVAPVRDISVSTHYIDLLCAAADAMHEAGLTPRQMVAAMCVIAATYVMKEDDDAR